MQIQTANEMYENAKYCKCVSKKYAKKSCAQK